MFEHMFEYGKSRKPRVLVIGVLVHAAGNGRAALATPRKREKAGSEDPAFSTTRARGGT
jgi:hypothetical protein